MNWTQDLVYGLDLLGTFVFAVSGILTAIDKKFDAVGAAVIGTATAVGGGTLRDLFIGNTPVGFLRNTDYVLAIGLALAACYLFYNTLKQLRKSMFIFDTIGIGLFTVIGVQITLAKGLSPVAAGMMGITSAVMGGVIRDTLTNRVPLIFRKEIYASACLAGALVYLLMKHFTVLPNFSMLASILVVIAIRTGAVLKEWELPFKPRI